MTVRSIVFYVPRDACDILNIHVDDELVVHRLQKRLLVQRCIVYVIEEVIIV